MNACRVSHSVLYQVLNAVSDGVFEENVEIIFHFKKETEKIVLLQVKSLIQIIIKFRTGKISVHVSIIHQTSFWAARKIVHQISCSNNLKRNKLKIYGSLKENKLSCFTSSKGSFQVHDLVHFWKNYYLRGTHSFLWWCKHVPESLSNTKTNCVAGFPICSALKNYLHWHLQFL